MALFNETNGAIVHEVKLTGLTGNVAVGKTPEIFTQYSEDGINWSQPKYRKIGTSGDRMRDITWYRQGTMKEFRMQSFSGTSDAFLSVARLDMRLEPLRH